MDHYNWSGLKWRHHLKAIVVVFLSTAAKSLGYSTGFIAGLVALKVLFQ
jgi:hypothetical protein